jgi:exosortase A-associated hydrolase 1
VKEHGVIKESKHGLHFRERFIVFKCEDESCIGVLSLPEHANRTARVGVVIVVGGPQTRVGSHRQFVLLSRALSGEGYPVFRFDYRGMGDSTGSARDFESIDIDIATAIDVLVRESGVSGIVLWGLCDGATAALMMAAGDRRVAGIVALNPWARSVKREASTRLRHYYLRRLLSTDFWKSLLSRGYKMGGNLRDFAGTVRAAACSPAGSDARHWLDRMERGWLEFERPVLLILSGRDLTAREFEGWLESVNRRGRSAHGDRIQVLRLANADHTFSRREWRDAVAAETARWLSGLDRTYEKI